MFCEEDPFEMFVERLGCEREVFAYVAEIGLEPADTYGIYPHLTDQPGMSVAYADSPRYRRARAERTCRLQARADQEAADRRERTLWRRLNRLVSSAPEL